MDEPTHDSFSNTMNTEFEGIWRALKLTKEEKETVEIENDQERREMEDGKS